MRIAKLILTLALWATVQCTFAEERPTASDLAAFDGPAIHVALDEVAVCVPRRFFDVYNAKTFSESKDANGTQRPVNPGRLELTLFLPDLEGYTNELFRDYARHGYDRRHSPSTWVRLDILNREVAAAFRKFTDDYQNFEAIYVDPMGLTSRRRKAKCIGETAGFGAGFLWTAGKECAMEELKEKFIGGHRLQALCTPAPGTNRCHVRTVQDSSGVAFKYDFAMQQLSQWDRIDTLINKRVIEWAEDHSCTH
jgi:hypothetical protein